MRSLTILFIVLLFLSCGSTKEVVYEAPIDYDIELLDTLTVSAPPMTEEEKLGFLQPVYNPEATRNYDLIHTKLDLAFDWEKQHVLGKAYLDLTPIFYPIQEVVLDAKQFQIHTVSLGAKGQNLEYEYNDSQIKIILDRPYNKGEKINLFIDYTAMPNEGPQGGSAAITSDKGLFFINPMNEDPDKPRQIWTQGETENNSKWFPTFDKPNERCTQEIYLTVEEGLETLSNGLLISTTRNGDGTKTDYWKMDQPHAPYLFMLTIGDFARVKDEWNGKPLEYMVDPPYEPSAKEIFNHTPEMLSFFSELLDYEYPWPKYSQVIAEDYVSGAMENTTGVIFGDFVQKTKRELIDNENDQIVAHEMFHHWFGDLVTCESWANLTLNEGFANYSEYLWYEHKYGKDAADAIRISEMDGYKYMAAQSGTHPLIHYSYEDKEDMFDAHSYNKGGLVLHMLRDYVGDEAFFAALSKYLKDNQYTAVETAELRIAFEETIGEDMNWFFDQWYLDEGHPQLQVTYDYLDGNVLIYVEQVQDPQNHRPVFRLPITAATYANDGSIAYHDILIDQRKDTIVLKNIERPLVTTLDGKAIVLGDVYEERDTSEWAALLQHTPYHFHKRSAISNLMNKDILHKYADQMMNDKNEFIRVQGVRNAKVDLLTNIERMITNDSHSAVRSNALSVYEEMTGSEALAVAEKVMKSEQAYPVLNKSLEIINRYDKNKALMYADELIKDNSSGMISTLASILAESGDAKYLNYFEQNLSKVGIYQIFNVFGQYSTLVTKQDAELMVEKALGIQSMALNDGNMYRRYLATNLIHTVRGKIKELKSKTEDESKIINFDQKIENLTEVIENVKSSEKDSSLLDRYSSF